jgi:adenine-specific DNA-methyltransferase
MNVPLGLVPHTEQKAAERISGTFALENSATLFAGDCLELLTTMPDACVQLVMTSPPYNIGKAYESRIGLDIYLERQSRVIAECVRVLAPGGSLCWQVGNYIEDGEVFPLDIYFYPIIKALGLKLRNRIIWRIEHGLHAKNRFSGRHETILWFTKGEHEFNVDPVRIPQKYPGKKAYSGAKAGEYSGNPLGKNPGDVWEIPNVKHNHIEKTEHPAAYPIELVERFVLSVTKPGDLIFDPYMGSGTTGCAGLIHNRRVAGAEVMTEYLDIVRQRWIQSFIGTLKKREMGKEIYQPIPGSSLTRRDDLQPIQKSQNTSELPSEMVSTSPKRRGRPPKNPISLDDGLTLFDLSASSND